MKLFLGSLKNDEKVVDYEEMNQDEREAEFRKLLIEIGTTHTWRWEDVHRILVNDERSKILKTIHEKKKIFHHYVSECKQKERQETRNKRQHVIQTN